MTYKLPLTTAADFGMMKVGSGLSVANGVVSATGTPGLSNYGFFTDGTQINPVASAVNLVTFSNTGPVNGVSVVGGNAITVANAGVYTKMFTLIISKTSGGTSSVSIWLRLNGVDIPGSRQDLELTNTLAQIFVSGNYTLSMTAGSNIQMCWSSADITVQISALPATVGPVRPSGDSTKVTITRIG